MGITNDPVGIITDLFNNMIEGDGFKNVKVVERSNNVFYIAVRDNVSCLLAIYIKEDTSGATVSFITPETLEKLLELAQEKDYSPYIIVIANDRYTNHLISIDARNIADLATENGVLDLGAKNTYLLRSHNKKLRIFKETESENIEITQLPDTFTLKPQDS